MIFLKLIFLIISTICSKEFLYNNITSIHSLKINHLKTPLGIGVKDNSFSFLTSEKGPFKASILSGDNIIQTKEVKLEECHSFSFNEPLEYNKIYKYVVESSLNKAELEFETTIKLEAPFIKPKNKEIFSPIFFKSFNFDKDVKRARLYITGLGLYQAFLNSNRIGNAYLTPGFNDYNYYVRYQTYDITNLIQKENNIEVHMGDGWYKGRFGVVKFNDNGDKIFGDEYKLTAHILVEFNDGEILNILTDETWKVKHSKEISNGIYDGEEVDFTLPEEPSEEVIISEEKYNLIPDFGTLIVEKDVLKPELISSPKGEQILDFKQNMVGFIRFKGMLNKDQELSITHGEVLQEQCFYNANYRSAKALLKYKGDGEKRTYEPKFTFYGFRYALIQGLEEVNPEDFEGVVIYTDLDRTIECETDNKKINQLIKNSFWGQRGNFLDVPTDCPQRDERLGWTADAQVFVNTACYNMDSYNFYKKFSNDLRGDQVMYYDGDFPMYCPSLKKSCQNGGAVWADSGTIIPWIIYMNYGDKLLLENNYPMMKEYAETLIKTDIQQGNRYLILQGFTYGDWLAQDGATPTSTMGGTDLAYIMSVYYYQSINIVASAAKELGKKEDYIKYTDLKSKIYNAILDEYFAPNGKLAVETQTGYVLSLFFKIYRNKERIVTDFKNRITKDSFKLKTGFTGTPLILLTMFDNGMDEDAYRLLYNEEFPGWIYAINLGATTIWERWNSLLEDGTISGTSMNSLNHYAYGSVCEAIYSRIAGLKNLSPGWKKVLIEPHLSYRMKNITFSYESVSGKYEINWKIFNDKFYMEVIIPNGAEAEIVLPNGEKYNVNEGKYNYECELSKKILCPFSIDTPLFEILKNEEASKIIMQLSPAIYYMAIGENEELRLGSIRLLATQPFIGVTPELVEKIDEELSKIRL